MNLTLKWERQCFGKKNYNNSFVLAPHHLSEIKTGTLIALPLENQWRK